MSRKYLLDTNHASDVIRNPGSLIRKRIRENSDGLIAISVITKAELIYGVKKKPEAIKLARAVGVFLSKVHVFSWTDDTAEAYGTLRAGMEVRGLTLGSMDMMIAAHALELDAILLTGDKAFSRVPSLRIDDWSL